MFESLKNRAKNLILTLIIVFVLFSALTAEVATYDEARQVCDNWLTFMVSQQGSWAGSHSPEIVDMREIKISDMLLGRCFVIKPSGYVVVPVLKELPPIKASSEVSQLDVDNIDGFAQMLKDILDHRINLYIELYGSLDAVQPDKGDVLLGREHRREWERFLMEEQAFFADMAGRKESMDEYGPLMTSQWDQYDPYNKYCPIGDGGRTVVGCVATAAAQLMYYHQWPPEGVGMYQYWWGGDYSCGGSSPGALLSADFSDSYDWATMPENCYSGCDAAQQDALAELSCEVGVAFNMDYGVCGSGTYTHYCMSVMPSYFRYLNQIIERQRVTHTLPMWSDLIRDEVLAGRPSLYNIYLHAIVCDGWRNPSETYQVHMNYGWADGHTAWYTIDNLHCDWEGCDTDLERIYINIEPDKRAWFTADTSWGFVPLSVNFSGNSSMTPDSWKWYFGDGDSSDVQSPNHSYDQYGQFDVTLIVNSAKETGTYTASNYIIALADTLTAGQASGYAGEQVVVEISAFNTVPLDRVIVPIEYSGDMDLELDSASVVGCRGEDFGVFSNPIFDPFNKRTVYILFNSDTAAADLAPGSGPLMKMYFTISPGATPDQVTTIDISSFYGYDPMFYGPMVDFSPATVDGGVSGPCDCTPGDANGEAPINIFDVTYVISYLYKGGPPPTPYEICSGDPNGLGCTCNIFDVTYLISYLYKSGPAPVSCEDWLSVCGPPVR